jgi:hypothetical protein
MTLLPTNRKAEADGSSLENPIYTSNVTTASTHNLSDRDSVPVRPPEYSLVDTLGVVEASQVAPNYSKRLSGNISSTHLCEFC